MIAGCLSCICLLGGGILVIIGLLCGRIALLSFFSVLFSLPMISGRGHSRILYSDPI